MTSRHPRAYPMYGFGRQITTKWPCSHANLFYLKPLTMNRLVSIFVLFLLSCSAIVQAQDRPIALVIHGGAGTILRENMTAEMEAEYRAKLQEALQVGYAVLDEGGTSLDAVVATIKVLEESPLFNAGRGAVYTAAAAHELDASIMNGANREAGAVAGVTNLRHPIEAARAVMEHSPHVMMAGPGAEQFAAEQNLELVNNDFFDTEFRKGQLEAVQEREHMLDPKNGEGMLSPAEVDYKFGTVGCVALDREGNLAAGTSTGGMTNKRYGRVGDSPVIGAGTFAENATCGVSATGHGEFFIRWTVASDIAALMRYQDLSVADAANKVVNEVLVEAGGSGGVIAMDRQGNVAMPHNTPGMYRGYMKEGGEPQVFIYGDETE